MLILEQGHDSPRPRVKPITLRSVLAVCALSLHAFVSLGMILAYAWRLQLLRSVVARVSVAHADLVTSDALIAVGSKALLGIESLAAITFICWFYRAEQNLRAFRSEPLEFTPSQAAWSFFIPFVNLVRPYEVMREIWRASDPSLPPFASASDRRTPVSRLILTWWLLFLLRGVIGWASFVPLAGGPTVSALINHAGMLEIDLTLSIVTAGIACTLILGIMKRQQGLAVQLERAAA